MAPLTNVAQMRAVGAVREPPYDDGGVNPSMRM